MEGIRGTGRNAGPNGGGREPTAREQQHADARRGQRTVGEALAERRRTVATALVAGMTQTEIARQLGLDKSTICEDVKVIRKQWRDDQNEDYQAFVDQEIERLNRLSLAYWERAIGNVAQRVPGNKDAAEVVLKCLDRRVKLLGLDAPERHIVTVTRDEEMTEISSRLAQLAEHFPGAIDGDEDAEEPEEQDRLTGATPA